MATIGERLRLRREQQGRSLAELAQQTCIASRYLLAIEADQPQLLPGHFFYRNFVRQYARALGSDPDSFDADLRSAATREDVDILPALSAAYQPAQAAPRTPRFRVALPLVLLFATVGLGGALALWWDRSQREEPAVAVRAAAPAPAPPAVPPAHAASAVAEVKTPLPEMTEPAKEPAVEAPPRGMQISASEPTWISVASGGRTIFSGMLQTAEVREFAGLENARVITGNAAGIEVSWHGRNLGPLGPRGQVRTLLLTPENFEIVSPRRM